MFYKLIEFMENAVCQIIYHCRYAKKSYLFLILGYFIFDYLNETASMSGLVLITGFIRDMIIILLIIYGAVLIVIGVIALLNAG